MIELDMIKQLIIAVVLGGIVGYERERAHKMAGIRTHALIAMGAALLTMLSVNSFFGQNTELVYDPGRIISNIVVGIGFIGGGAILRKNDHVVGITTASTLWVVAIIGIAVGLGENKIAAFASIVSYLILTLIWLLERNVGSSTHYGDTIEAVHEGTQHESEK